MRTATFALYVSLAVAALCQVGLTSPIVKRQVLDNPKFIDPAEQDLEAQDEADRGKRKIEGAVELTYGAKNAILGLFFNHTYKHLLKPKLFFRHKRAIGVSVVTLVPKKETTTEDIVLFTPGERVSLEVPDQLFGSGYTLITNVSEIIGNLIQNSAERTARVFESMKPFLQGVFGVKSLTITRDGAQSNKV